MMKRTLLIAALLLAGAAGLQAQNYLTHPGYVDFSKLKPLSQDKPTVRVHLKDAMLKMALTFGMHHDKHAADVLKGLDLIHVETYNAEGKSREELEKGIHTIQVELKNRQWENIIQIDEEDETIDMSVLMNESGMIQGLMVMAMEWDNELTFVNLVGSIDPAQLSSLNDYLDLPVDVDIIPDAARIKRRDHNRHVEEFHFNMDPDFLKNLNVQVDHDEIKKALKEAEQAMKEANIKVQKFEFRDSRMPAPALQEPPEEAEIPSAKPKPEQ